jgi:single-stranded DNA-specific DHH superfamily exonuclease
MDDQYGLATSWINTLSSFGSIVIVYHRDPDGVCSAVIMSKLLERTGKTNIRFISSDAPSHEMEDELLRKLMKDKPAYIIFLDLAIDQLSNMVQIMKERSGAKIMIIDHHQLSIDLNPTITHINPRLKNRDVYLPASYLTYKIAEKMLKAKDLDWVAVIGIVGDHAFSDCKEFLEKFTERERIENLRKSDLGLLASVIELTRPEEKIEEFVKLLSKYDSYRKLIKENKSLFDEYWEIKKQIDQLVDDFENKAEFFKDAGVAIYEIDSERPLQSMVSGLVSERFPVTTIIVGRESGGKYRCSVRNQMGVDVSTLVKKATIGIIGGSGGGHPQAAGAKIPKNDWQRFKNN